jgi:hypothetical protein
LASGPEIKLVAQLQDLCLRVVPNQRPHEPHVVLLAARLVEGAPRLHFFTFFLGENCPLNYIFPQWAVRLIIDTETI